MDIVIALAKTPNSVVLIKGQDVDLRANRPNLIQSKLSNHVHKIVFIHAPAKVIMKRLKTKTWFDPKTHTQAEVRNWLVNHQLKMLMELKGFEFVAVNAEKDYKVLEFQGLDFLDWDEKLI